jgi:hypothetical protein
MIFLFFGQYKEMGYLPQAMVNYLALLGWGDGTENEFFTIGDLGLSATIHSVIFTRIFFLYAPSLWPHFSFVVITCLCILTLVPFLIRS